MSEPESQACSPQGGDTQHTAPAGDCDGGTATSEPSASTVGATPGTAATLPCVTTSGAAPPASGCVPAATTPVSKADMELLARLEEQNRQVLPNPGRRSVLTHRPRSLHRVTAKFIANLVVVRGAWD